MVQLRPWVIPWVLGLSTGMFLGRPGLVPLLLTFPVCLATLIVVVVQLRRDERSMRKVHSGPPRPSVQSDEQPK